MAQPTYRDCTTLEALWAEVYKLNRHHFPGHTLMPIMGNGRTHKPRAMLVFINPTRRNASSRRDWAGPRFPFIGTKQVWNVLSQAGLFDENLTYRIQHGTDWDLSFTRAVLDALKKRSMYLTNIVKWTGHDAELPDSLKIKLFLPILEREVELVQPDYIIAFGQIPFTHLTRQKIKLADYYEQSMASKKLRTYDCMISATKTKVVPCYFPVGRGNPKRAVELLRLLPSLP